MHHVIFICTTFCGDILSSEVTPDEGPSDMESIRELYRIGTGPSSSHTMAPRKAAETFLKKCPDAKRYRITLYGSLAATGKGHLTDLAITEALQPHPVELIWKPEIVLAYHPNGMLFEAFSGDGTLLSAWQVYSVGGGALEDESTEKIVSPTYELTNLESIVERCKDTGESLWEYVLACEGEGFTEFLGEVWDVMSASIERGLNRAGILPGGLGVGRKAHSFYRKSTLYGPHLKHNAQVWAYALAVSEENASGGVIVTAPTCGASGVLPAVLRSLDEELDCGREDILRALATAGLIGNLVKYNASISGAEVGCQGEVGTACAMAAAAAMQLHGGTVRQIEYAAEMGLEHHLGLTCDPVNGLVQIPCIERNAHAATRALSCCYFALLAGGEHKITFDEITMVMKETGQALPLLYRETAGGGMAEAYRNRKKD